MSRRCMYTQTQTHMHKLHTRISPHAHFWMAVSELQCIAIQVYSATVKLKTIFQLRAIPLYTSSQTPFFVHLLNEDSSLKQTVCFVPGERKSLPYIISFNLIKYEHPVNKYTFYGPLGVCINRFDCTSKQGRGLHVMYFTAL